MDETGNIVLDESSLTVATGPPPTPTITEADILVDGHRHISSSSYSNRAPADRWTAEDTELFFQGLRCWGTDFAMVSRLFPTRSRRQVKNKYKREERLNPQRIDAALSGPRGPQGTCRHAREGGKPLWEGRAP